MNTVFNYVCLCVYVYADVYLYTCDINDSNDIRDKREELELLCYKVLSELVPLHCKLQKVN